MAEPRFKKAMETKYTKMGKQGKKPYLGPAILETNPIKSLRISASPTTIMVGTPTNIIFFVTSNGEAINGAIVCLSGAGVSVNGTTDASGRVTISVNATSTGSITAEAIKITYETGSITLNCKITK